MTRNGKHKDGSVRMGVYVPPFRKAVAVYLADLTDKTMTDIIWEGIETVAKSRGVILPSGEVAPQHLAAINTTIEVIKATNQVKG